MPVYSMTGFAGVQQSGTSEGAANPRQALRLGVEIRAVNSRFLDLSFKLSDDLRQHEAALRELLQTKLKRGKVELRAYVESAAGAGLREPGSAQLQRLNALQDAVIAWLPQARPLSVADALRLAADERPVQADQGPALLQLAAQALDSLLAARAREGDRLAQMLVDRCAGIAVLAERVEPLVPQLVAQSRQRFLDRWQDAVRTAQASTGAHAAVDPERAQERALTEAAAFAIRIDVAEELTRLQSHLQEIQRQLTQGGEVGKRLEFLIQELHREANTLGSKSPALELTQIAIDMKVLIEQMREQVQNIE